MDKKTLKALKKSIKKWEKIVNEEGVDWGLDCSLCKLFIENNCVDCPVYIKTKMRSCIGTPYAEWVHHQRDSHVDEFTEAYEIECPKCKELARKELEFLKSLLPEKEGE